MGQTEETYITRFVVKDTIDDKLVTLQKQKDDTIFAAIDENRILDKLSITNLLRLFGPVDHRENGNPFILKDDSSTGQAETELDFNDTQGQTQAKGKKSSKAKGPGGAKGGKGSKATRGGKGAKARRIEADLEAIERDIADVDDDV